MNNSLNNEIKFYKNKFISFKNKFNIISKIKETDKLGLNDNTLYLDNYNWSRYLMRRILRQNYIKINNYFKSEFNIFIKFLDQYLEYLNVTNKKNILTNEIYFFIDEIIKGFYNLKISYKYKRDFLITINGIILTLYSFNEAIEDKLYKNIKGRKNSI